VGESGTLAEPAPEPAADATDGGLATAFDRDAITGTRHLVAAWAANAGLLGQRLEGFVLAVNEIITNAVRHGGGRGRLRLWAAAGVVWCEIRDHGPGPTAAAGGQRRPTGYELPPTSATGGRGLWLARHLCDTLSFDRRPDGTTVQLTIAVRPGTR
jgi:serine/threonine-protein kinase RsbW